MTVYLVTNLINGKIYVGKTVGLLADRIKIHLWFARTRPVGAFHHAVRKYGWENFTVAELASANSKEELLKLEIYYIASLRANVPGVGYNLTSGGDGHPGYSPSVVTRAKISAANKGRKHSAESRLNMSRGAAGRIYTEEQRKKIGEGLRRFKAARPPRTHCKRGHALTGDNLRFHKNGCKICIVCWYLLSKHTLPEKFFSFIGNSTEATIQ